MKYVFTGLKLVRDTALWLTCAAAIVSIFTPISSLAAVPFLIGVGAWLAALLYERAPRLRLIGLAPALASLLFCSGVGDVLLVLPVLVYLVICICRGLLSAELGEMQSHFSVCAAIALLGGIFCAARGIEWAFGCCLIFLCVTVFLMRVLRHEGDSNRYLLALECMLMVIICVVCLLASRPAVLYALRDALKACYQYLIYPILMMVLGLMYYLFRGIIWILAKLLPDIDLTLNTVALEVEETAEETMPELVQGSSGTTIQWIAKGIGILIFALIAALIIRRLLRTMHSRQAGQDNSGTRRAMTPDELHRAEAPLRRGDRSPEAKVRRAYADYCAEVNRACAPIKPSDTTRSVNARAVAVVEPNEAERLRALYLRARYTADGALTADEAKEAQQISKKLKEELKQST